MSAVLDCGHPPSAHGDSTTGYGVARQDGRRLCYECCAELDRESARRREPLFLYLTQEGDGFAITSWPGVRLGTATARKYQASGFGGRFTAYSVHATIEGTRYYGRSGGPGMYIKLRPIGGAL